MTETQPKPAAANPEIVRRGIAILTLGAVYFGAARLGLLLASIHGSVSPVWPATGVAIGALLLGGIRLWPGVALGAFLANVLTAVSPVIALGICAGNTLEAVAGAWIFIRCTDALRRSEMEQLATPAAFALTAMVAPLVSASCGVLSLLAGNEIQRSIAGTLWLTWWVGDALGALTIAPLLLAVRDARRERRPWTTQDIIRAMAMVAATVAVCLLVFFRPVSGSFVFMVFPVLLLAVAWFGSTGVKLTSFLISALSIGAAFYGSGPFLGGRLNEDLLHLQLFLTSVVTAALLLPVIRANGRLMPLSLLLLVGWALAAWLLSSLHKDRLRNDATHFDTLVAHATYRLQQRLTTYEDSLRGGAGLFVASKLVGSAEWRAYVQALRLPERYPGIHGVAVILPVRPEDAEAFVSTARAEGQSDFAITPVPGIALPVDGLEERQHFVVTYIEPLEANRRVVGLDIASESIRRTAAEESRDSGEPRLAPAISPVQDLAQRPGFLLFVPLYRAGAPIDSVEQRRAALAGWVNAVFITEDFFNGVFGSRPGELALHFHAGRSPSREHLLYASPGSEPGPTTFERVTELPLGGRMFSVGWNRGPEFASSGESPAVWAATSSAVVSFLMVGLVISLQTVSRRARAMADKRAEELVASEERFRLLIENVQDYAIFVLDPDGRVASWNRGAERIKGYAAGEIIGRHFSVFYPAEDAAVGKPARGLATATALGRVEDENWLMRKDGTRFWGNKIITVLRNREGAAAGFVVVTRDFTVRKQLEENLARARDDALQMSRFKSEFLATMSHEIRTPMNGVIGMVSLLMQTSLTVEQRRMGRVLESSAESLLTIINDILDFSKIEAGKLRLEATRFLLREVIEETLALLAPRAHEKRLELACDFDAALDMSLSGDPGRIRQVLTNLLNNAINFTAAGEVILSAQLLRSSAGRTAFRLTVRDTGIGIDAETRAHLFEPYTQADGIATRRPGGTGLGLAICRRLVDLMRGTLDFESTPGRGSTFWFELELPSDTLKSGGRPMSALPFGLSVLVVDDNSTNRGILLAQLARFGLQAEAVADGRAALAWLRTKASAGTPCQLALLDWDMPGMNGLQVGVAIRADAAFARLPLVMLSSAGPLDDPTIAADVGFAVYLTKPVREAQLHRCLARVLDDPETLAAVPTLTTEAAVTMPRESGLSLLLAEDSISNQMVARMLLEKMGHGVTVASNGKEALALLAQASFDAVIMDCQMPVMDGYEVTRRIRSGQEPGVVPWIPVIAVTVNAMPEDRQKCLNAGMDDYLTKPVHMSSLHEAFLRCGLVKGSAGFQSPEARALRYHQSAPASQATAKQLATDPMDSTPSPAANPDRAIPPILIVDDDPNDLALIRHSLEEARVEHPIIAVTSGEAAVDFLTRTYLEPALVCPPLPQVIFLDIVMRGMNGFQLLTWIRGQSALRAIKVVMVSSIATPREIELSREFGADLHVVKYPAPELLTQIVTTSRKVYPRF